MFKNILKLFNILLESENFVFVNTPLQFINFIEFKNLKQINKKIFSGSPVFITNSNYYETRRVVFLNKKNGSHNLININSKFNKIFFYLFIFLKYLFFKNLKHIVIGDYNNNFLNKVSIFFKNVIILDDGTNILIPKKIKFNFKSYIFFSFFKSKQLKLNKTKILTNDFKFLKRKLKKQKTSKKIFLLGAPFVSKKIVSNYNYIKLLSKIHKLYKKYEVLYFPHPKEDIYELKKLKIFKIINPKVNIENYLIHHSNIPFKIIGFNSTAFITIKKIYKTKIKLENYFYCQKDCKFLFDNEFTSLQIKIILFFKKYLKIKTKYIYL